MTIFENILLRAFILGQFSIQMKHFGDSFRQFYIRNSSKIYIFTCEFHVYNMNISEKQI